MMLKRIGAVMLAAVLLLACLPLAVSAAGTEPTMLLVGEKNKTEDNLIRKYIRSGQVDVYEVSENSTAYYTLTKNEKIGYILTFYNDYVMSEIVESSAGDCGLYCDGDLTVRIAGNVKFDANDKTHADAYGWKVKGTLTIEGAVPNASLTVNGNKTMRESDDGGIGICADTLLLHDVCVNACGGYAAVQAKSALVTADAALYANTDASMKKNGKTCFAYSIETNNFIQSGGYVKADGDVLIEAFCFKGDAENKFEEKVVVYGRSYTFARDNYDGAWSSAYDLFKDPSLIPSCMKVSLGSSVAKISGNRLALNRRGMTTMTLTVQCGSAVIVMDSAVVLCTVQWWQWIPYIISGAWLDAFFG